MHLLRVRLSAIISATAQVMYSVFFVCFVANKNATLAAFGKCLLLLCARVGVCIPYVYAQPDRAIHR